VAIANASTWDGSKSCATDVVVVSGTNFPDALAASFLGKPVLLTESTKLTDATKTALQQLGVENVTIVGGTSAVSSDVFNAIKAQDKKACGGGASTGTISVTRIAGGNRYDTARAVAVSNGNNGAGNFDSNVTGACDAVKTVILTSGENFPDALAAGALAASGGTRACGGAKNIPLVLTEPGTLRPEAQEAIGALKPKSVIIVGGTTAVSDTVKGDVDALDGVDNVTRIAGTTRFETAAKLSDVLLDTVLGNFMNRFLVASGLNFPDALVSGPWAGKIGAPIVLSPTASLGADAATAIKNADGSPVGTNTVLRATLLGGTGALSNVVGADTGAAFTGRN
jgi:putative cell wall-binding protein